MTCSSKRRISKYSTIMRNNVEHILFTMGGTDENNITAKFIENIIRDKSYNNIIFHIVVGSFNKNLESLNKLVFNYSNVKLHYNVKKMDELMKVCDIAVSAGGTTLLELSACGVPTISFTIADNQIEGTKCLSEEQAIIYVGDARRDINRCIENIFESIQILTKDEVLRRDLSKNMNSLIDGNGAQRIVNEIISLRHMK